MTDVASGTRLLVASTGGHLVEMRALAPRLVPQARDEIWVTFDSHQSRSLLAEKRVEFVRDTPPRDWRGVLFNIAAARQLFKKYDVESVISSGAGVALSFLPLARAKGIAAHYIESCARIDGPSLTGTALERVGGMHLYTQHRALSNRRWRFRGSSFDSYRRVPVKAPKQLRSVVVTVGTLPFRFERLLLRLRSILPADVEVLVQCGSVGRDFSWPGATIVPMLSPEELRDAITQADAVVAHAGVGSFLMSLDAGKVPILAPRMLSHREHVDDHQVHIARAFASEGLAIMTDAAEISVENLVEASNWRIARRPDPVPFTLMS